jgi:hypothetical protein
MSSLRELEKERGKKELYIYTIISALVLFLFLLSKKERLEGVKSRILYSSTLPLSDPWPAYLSNTRLSDEIVCVANFQNNRRIPYYFHAL